MSEHRGPKHCPKCQKQGKCYDSRTGDGYVRRTYRCDCGERWSTAEIFVTDVMDTYPNKIRNFVIGRNTKQARDATNESIQKAIDTLTRQLRHE